MNAHKTLNVEYMETDTCIITRICKIHYQSPIEPNKKIKKLAQKLCPLMKPN